MDISSYSSSSSDEDDGIFFNMFASLLRLDDSDEDVDVQPARAVMLGGGGTGRPFRKKPRKFDEGGLTPEEQRRRDHLQSPWSTRYFTAPLRPSSLAFDSFRQKFRVPYPMFNWLVGEAIASAKFPDELIRKRGRPPAPLNLQIAAALRFIATGCPIDCNEEAA